MSHKHSLYDTDPHFSIDPETRLITDMSNKGTTIVQNDHNSERFTFELPRLIDGHDMSLCNVVEVHYINIGNNERHSDVYEITDLQVSPDSNDVVICSWLLSQNATALSGTINFVLRFACTSQDESGEAIIDYSWSTGIYTKIVITPGIFNSEAVAERYADVLEEWRQELFGSPEDKIDTYSKQEIDKLLSNPTITDTILLTNDITLNDPSSYAFVTSEDDEIFVTNDGVSTSTLTKSMMAGGVIGATFNISVSGYIKFTCNIDNGYADVYVDGAKVDGFGSGIGYNGEYSYSFEGEVKDTIRVFVESNEITFTEFKRITVIANELPKKANADEVYTKPETDIFMSKTANAFTKTVSGEVIRVNDVSPLEHTVKVKVSGKNLLNADGLANATFVKNDDGSFTFTKNGSARFTNFVDFSVSPNTIVSVSATSIEGTADGFAFQIQNQDGDYVSIVSLSSSKSYAAAKITDKPTKIRLYLGGGEADGAYLNISGLQIELGDAATEYEPYVDPSTVTVTECGKNLLDISKARTMVVGSSGSQRSGLIFDKTGTYTLSCNTATGIAVKTVTDGVYGEYTTLLNDVVYTFNLADNQYLIIYQGAENVPLSHDLNNPQLELGDTATVYEPYTEPKTYTPDSNGTLEIDSISPTMTVLTDTDGANVELTYNRDINKVMGDVESVLDVLHEYAQALISGGVS